MSTPDINDVPIRTAFSVYPTTNDLAWIGLLSVLWSQVEFCVEFGLYHFQGVSFEQGRTADSLKRDISERIKQLSTLVGDNCERKERMLFLGLLDRAAALAGRRNLAIHGHWVLLADHDNRPGAVSWRRVPVGEPVNRLEASELPGMAQEAGLIADGLYRLIGPRDALAFMAR